jgi:predicted dehydrogenase
VQGPGLVAADGVELVGVWGRTPERAAALAAELGVPAYDDFDALIAEVDAVAFAVPPAVQAELAVRAAAAGRHLLLDKPVAMDVAGAHAVRDAVGEAGVGSVVFFTDRFVPTAREWFARLAATDGWRGGWLRWFSALQHPGNPYAGSPWRHEHGALWDTGPHAISTLSAALGPVRSVRASGGAADLVVLTLTHESGATSTATLTAFAPVAATGFEAAVWGDAGVHPMPPRPDGAAHVAFRTAVEELVASVRSGEPHPVDAALGARVVELIAEAADQLDR